MRIMDFRRVFAVGFGLLVMTSGCTRVDRLPPEPVAPSSPAVEQESAHEAARPPLDAQLLEQATAHFEAGRLQQAANLNRRLLEMDDVSAVRRERALWSLAMIHLLPESPLHDPTRARTDLAQLSEDHGESIRGAQARWLLTLLDDLDEVRGQVAEQTELLEQLTVTVEQLRRIDLNRRPSSGGGGRSEPMNRPH
ncbi:MAG: hypothetical protein EA422_01555 [Gemmatimonadales bacterium]|nr:MAG: hypothetical protein EA422_01555 [Gemmatimonadales bacterium]